MTRDDIIHMAREAGFEELFEHSDDWVCFTEEIERFAALVAAHEREACANVCDEMLCMVSSGDEYMDGVTDCISAIRARRNK